MEAMTMAEPAKLEARMLEAAFERMGMQEKIKELWEVIDEIALEEELRISKEACERGEHFDVFEALEEIRKEINER
jgi:hypothetical protein